MKKFTIKTKLLIYEYKQIYPNASPEFISELFNIELSHIIKLFNTGEINVPSKMNK
jgi:hypothetical protein